MGNERREEKFQWKKVKMGIDKVTLGVGENGEGFLLQSDIHRKRRRRRLRLCDLRPTKANYYSNKVSLKRAV